MEIDLNAEAFKGCVIRLDDERRKRDARRGKLAPHVTFRVNEAGKLLITRFDRNDCQEAEWRFSREGSEKIIDYVWRALVWVRRKEYLAANPPKVKPPPKWRACLMCRSGLWGACGCRRREGHAGEHRDSKGSFEVKPRERAP